MGAPTRIEGKHGALVGWGGGVQAMASWRSPLTRRHWINLSESRIKAVQCYDCPMKRCGSGHNMQWRQAESDTRKCSGNCHARRHPCVLLEHKND